MNSISQLFEEAAWNQLFIPNRVSTIFRHPAFLHVSSKQELVAYMTNLLVVKINQIFFTFISRPLRRKIKFHRQENVIFLLRLKITA